jgi:spermidine/putrescine transport system ATP-binding protein
MADLAVELREVTKRFSSPEGTDVLAVDHVSLPFCDGEFSSLLGPSGCGKTTSLRLIAGFEQPTSGEVVIAGQSMGMTPPFQRPVNTVFQSYALFPHMTVGQNVAFGLEMSHVPTDEVRRRVTEALAMVRLPGLEKRYPKQLSGGQQQRVALARALVNRPKVLLLDEPLGALDLKLRKDMQLELKSLQREVGITFIYVTHDQEEALTMSDRIAVMSSGRVLQLGTPSEIYEQPRTRFVADFIGETNFLVGEIVSLEGGRATVDCGGARIWADCGSATARGAQVTVAIRPEKIRLGTQATSETPNCFPVHVEHIVYVGTDTRFDVRLTAEGLRRELKLSVRHQNLVKTSDPRSSFGGALDLYASWVPESARVLTE